MGIQNKDFSSGSQTDLTRGWRSSAAQATNLQKTKIGWKDEKNDLKHFSIKARSYLFYPLAAEQFKVLMFKQRVKDVRHLIESTNTSQQTNLQQEKHYHGTSCLQQLSKQKTFKVVNCGVITMSI